MCGIVGIWDFQNKVDKGILKRMRDLLKHRGPDDKGIFIDDHIGLGHRRLSIIDLSKAGHQPMSNEDGTVWITYNGEIYNFLELRDDLEKKGHQFKSDTDTEVIIHAYEEYGEKCVTLFNGMFAFAIWDSNKKQLFLARDRVGIKPLYYSQFNNTFLFASEIKSILSFPKFERRVNERILRSFLRFSYYLDNSTLFEGVSCLKPGFYGVLGKSGFNTYKYWDVKFGGRTLKNKEAIKKELLEKMESSIKKRMIADVPLGAFLSGGLDSSAIVALMSKFSQNVKTFSVGFDNYDDELPMAKFVSEIYSTDHTELSISAEDYYNELASLVWHHDDPITHKASIPLYFLSEKTKRNATVILSGEGSDELFAGYSRYKKILPLYLLNKAGSRISGVIQKVVKSGGLADFKIKKYLDYISKDRFKYMPGCEVFPSFTHENVFTNSVNDDTSEKTISGYYDGSLGLLNNNLYVDIKTYLVSLLMKQDKMGMAASIESRVPYLDHSLIEFAAQIPHSLKLHNFTSKYILKETLRGTLPKKIIDQRKRGFPVPTNNWWRKELDGVPEEILLSKESVSKKYFRLNKIKQMIYDHRKGINNFDEQITFMINFELWNKVFIENIYTKAPKLEKLI